MVSSRILQLVRERLERMLNFSGGFGANQVERLVLGKVDLEGVELDGEDDTKPTRGAQAVVECLLTVAESCCNQSQNAHGGFLAFLIDHCSSLALLALSGPGERWITSGVSTNLNIFYIGAAPIGTPLRIVTRVLQQGRITALLETRITHAESGQLLCFATHTKQDPQKATPKKAKL
ncbi:hypothetical protein JCM11641_004431 [Rhodosporidiobolus odoratus]